MSFKKILHFNILSLFRFPISRRASIFFNIWRVSFSIELVSKIPVLGDIIIPKEVGEGLFGISFKMKGPPDNIKTNINPIRTITPRFIQKIIDRNKNAK